MSEPDTLAWRGDTPAHEMEELIRGWSGASRFIMVYRFALYEITTKINILREEFGLIHDYNPIERVDSRLKSVPRILEKAQRLGCGLTADEVRAPTFATSPACESRAASARTSYTIFEMFCDPSGRDGR